MDTQRTIGQFIRDASLDAVETIVADLCDIALVVDRDGIVRDVPHVCPAAEGLDPREWRGRRLAETAVVESRRAVGDLLDRLKLGRPVSGEEIIHRVGGSRSMTIRYGGAAVGRGDVALLLGRAVPTPPMPSTDFAALFAAGADNGTAPDARVLADMVRLGTDLAAVVDRRGRILWANDAFQAGAQASMVHSIEGRFLDDLLRWDETVDLYRLLETAGEAGSAGPVASTLIGDAGGSMSVSVALTRLHEAEPRVYGVVMRRVSGASASRGGAVSDLETALLETGGLPLKGLVRESAELVERQCLQAALRLTNNNRSAAAKVLGISRQALYLKLERFGLQDE